MLFQIVHRRLIDGQPEAVHELPPEAFRRGIQFLQPFQHLGVMAQIFIQHPGAMIAFLLLTAVAFSLFGFILGIWADNFEKLGIIPMLFLTPLTFLGGTFYSIDMLPKPWDTIALANPIVYLVSGLRWTFYGTSDVNIWVSFGITLGFLALCVSVIAYIFKTGWRLRA